MLAFALLVVSAGLQPVGRVHPPDAGVAPVVGREKKPPLDAGIAVVAPVALPPVASVVPVAAPSTSANDIDQLRRDVVDLKARTVQLEQQASQATAMSSQLDKLSKQISDLQTQLSDTENRRIDTERRATERRERNELAVTTLGTALQQLATGNANVGPALSLAESTFTGQALSNVQSARAALANGDLGSARVWLNQAIIESQASR